MIVRKLLAISAAAALVVAPTVAYSASPFAAPQAASARTGAALTDASDLQGRGLPIFLGLLVLVAIIAVAVTGDDERPDNTPVSP